MALSQVTLTVVDGGIGILPADTSNIQVSMGCCSNGVAGTFYALGSLAATVQYLGYGPLAEAVALKQAAGAPQQYAYVLPQTNTGALSASVTQYGTGHGAEAVSLAPASAIVMTCTTGGAFATAKFTFTIGSGAASQPVTSAASVWAYTVPGTSTILTVTAAGGTQTFTAGDTWSISSVGVVTAGGSNVTTNTVTQASQPYDQYEGIIKIVKTGTFGTATFKWALDYRIASDGTDISNYSAAVVVPTGGKYAIPLSGIYITFSQPTILVKITTGGALGTMCFDTNVAGAGYSGSPTTSSATASTTYAVAGTNTSLAFTAATYTLNDVWTVSALNVVTHTTGAGAGQPSVTGSSFVAGDYGTFLAAPPSPSNTDITTAGTALIADQTHQWSIAQIVNVPVSASAAATTESTTDTFQIAGFAAYRYFRVLSECPTVNSIIMSGGVPIYDTADTDTVVASAFSAVLSTLGGTQVGAGDFDCVSPLTGRYQRRNAIWQEAARLNSTTIATDPGQTSLGGVKFTRALYRDEAQVPALDAARLVTLRTYQGQPGFYITAGPTMASPTSDFAQIPNCRVIDRACVVTYAALFPFLRSTVPVNASGGTIQEGWAQRTEGIVNGKESAALLATGQVSGGGGTNGQFFAINRNNNILSTGILDTTVSIVPLGYAYQITASIGFRNPTIAAASAA